MKYEQAQCSLATAAATTNNTYSCFDLARCIARAPPNPGDQGGNVTSSSGTTRDRMILPMKVYAHGSSSARLIQRISNQSGIPVQYTANPDEACLFFANTKDAVQSTESPHFHHGQNHFILLTNAGDHPFDKTQFEMAALGMMTKSEAHFREGYDMSLPLPRLWRPPVDAAVPPRGTAGPRKYLLAFKGSIQDTLQPYYQHRWLAAEYLWNEEDVVIDVQCKHLNLWGTKRVFAPYDDDSKESFNDLMLNSTFGFCPGGSGVSSYRFGEVLSVGGVPVIVPGMVPPLAPEVDWSRCIVVVSEARIVDMPRLLRSIEPEEVRKRQVECRRLYEAVVKNPDDTTAVAMRIWVERIRNAIEFRNHLTALKSDLF